jgi:hypothetical protein
MNNHPGAQPRKRNRAPGLMARTSGADASDDPQQEGPHTMISHPACVTPDEETRKHAAQIVEYWASRGWRVTITIRDGGFHRSMRQSCYELRSDLVNGLPAPLAAARAAARSNAGSSARAAA